MSDYHIIDEPKVRFAENLIVNPIVILLAGMLVPMFLDLPLLGRFWMPFLWLIVNGYLLGSPSLVREVIYSILGAGLTLGFYWGFLWFGGIETRLLHYFRTILFAMFFMFLYLTVFSQSVSYSIYKYIKDGQHV